MKLKQVDCKPCPFCGCISLDLDPNWQAHYAVVCRDCQSAGPLSRNELMAEVAWQNRFETTGKVTLDNEQTS